MDRNRRDGIRCERFRNLLKNICSVLTEQKPIGIIQGKKERKMMKRWMVFDRKMDVVGFVNAANYTLAFIEAKNRFRDVDYIQEC